MKKIVSIILSAILLASLALSFSADETIVDKDDFSNGSNVLYPADGSTRVLHGDGGFCKITTENVFGDCFWLNGINVLSAEKDAYFYLSFGGGTYTAGYWFGENRFKILKNDEVLAEASYDLQAGDSFFYEFGVRIIEGKIVIVINEENMLLADFDGLKAVSYTHLLLVKTHVVQTWKGSFKNCTL